MVLISGGKSFLMGSDAGDVDARSDEARHWERIDSFCIAKTETTVAEYQACVDRGECKSAVDSSNASCNGGKADYASLGFRCVKNLAVL